MEINRLGVADIKLAGTAIEILKNDESAAGVKNYDNSYLEKFLGNPSNYFIVATEKGKPAGFVLAYELDRPDRPQPMILLYEVNVLGNKRRQGIAIEMINSLKEICTEKNIYKMWLVTNEKNKPAIRTFESTGGKLVNEDDVVLFEYLSDK